MRLHVYKYQGAGNDFVLIDNRKGDVYLDRTQIAWLCDRHFGIGADGLMLLQEVPGADFEMIYFNADGQESTMCGNGGRCIAAFAHRLGMKDMPLRFKAIDGMHEATLLPEMKVALLMQDVDSMEHGAGYTYLDTGSPHFITWVDDINSVDVVAEGRAIRHQERFEPKGVNVNFVQRQQDSLCIRTYERGVEDETLACGTGITAAAIASVAAASGHFSVSVKARGGDLQVSFDKTNEGRFRNIILQGPAQFVFEADITI